MDMLIMSITPTIISGIVLWYVKKKLEERDHREEDREQVRVQNNALLLKAVSASLLLGEATADAVVTGANNGAMQAARAYAIGVKVEIDNFMYRQSSERVR